MPFYFSHPVFSSIKGRGMNISILVVFANINGIKTQQLMMCQYSATAVTNFVLMATQN